ncbi:MAG TPA: PD-(D/E)XK nuclease family protein [Flavobacteriales bacterium]|nr:PD-(D/E)XK nuclease family protein [Flavobacteriales bacterium]
MEPFLRKVAKAIIKEHPDGLRDVAVVLPSQRAGLYLRKWIAEDTGKAQWSPQLFTIGTFMEELSGLRPLANEELLFEGYEAYRKAEGEGAQPLGDFLRWGNTALADISEADAHLVNLDTYYRDLRMWEDIEWTFKDQDLSPGQYRMIRYWAMVGRLHAALNTRLLELGAGTSGLIERTAVAGAKQGRSRWKAVWFAGLNAFTPAQAAVVRIFRGNGLARMAWEGDRYYVEGGVQEAGHYLRKAIGEFGPGVIPLDDGFSGDTGRIKAVRAPNNVAQAWCAAELLKQAKTEERNATTLVLADESLLPPLLEALPRELGPFNITMGLPAAQLPVGSFLEALHQLFAGARPGQGFFLKDLERLLGHPFLRDKNRGKAMIEVLAEVRRKQRPYHDAAFLREAFGKSGLFPEAEGVFIEMEDVARFMPDVTARALAWAMKAMAGDGFALEQIFQASRVLQRVHLMLDRYGHQLDVKAYATVFRRLLAGARIGFYGEPLAGVQVMGMLEARALDTGHLILLGAKEGVLPANTTERSYIPFELRRGHAMPMRDETDAVQAYNFMRMLQRCESATLVWPEEDEGGGPSRFIMQLQHELFKERDQAMEVREARTGLAVPAPVAVKVRKDDAVLEALRRRLDKGLSPSALGDWLRCPLDFHFKQVLRLKESDEHDARIAANVLGEALHNAMEGVLEPFLGRQLVAEELEKAVVGLQERLTAELGKKLHVDQLTQGQPMLQFHMALHAARRFLLNEVAELRAGAQVTVLAQELGLDAVLQEATEAIGSTVRIQGRLDRVDKLGQMVRILDLKTGRVKEEDLKVGGWDLKDLKGSKRYAAQLMVYAWLYLKRHPDVQALQAGILPLQTGESNKPLLLQVGGRDTITRDDLPAMAGLLAQAVKEMMDPALPVEHDPESKYCAFCLAEAGD